MRLACASALLGLLCGNAQQTSPECVHETCTEDLLRFSEDDSVSLLQKNAEFRKSQAALTHPAGAAKQLALHAAPSTVGRLHSAAESFVGLDTFYQHLTHTVRAGPVCSEFVDNALFFAVSLAIPCIMVIVFCAGTVWLSYAYPRPSASESAHHVTRIDKDGMPVSINWHFVTWTGLAIGMCNINYVVVLPIAVEDFSGSMFEAGCWVGLYAVGALISLPLFVVLGTKYTRTALVIHGLTTLIGNVVMIYGAMIQSMPWLMSGRVATGMSFGIYYTCNQGCMVLIPTWDRLEAIFISRCVYSIGFAVGPCISPLCNFVLTKQPWIMHYFPNYNASAEGTPLILMALYGLFFSLGSLFVFKEMEILDAETEGVGVGASREDPSENLATWEETKEAAIIFTSVTFTNFSRNLIRVLWETGTVVILAKVYCVSTIAGIVVSIVAVTLVVSRSAINKLGLACKEDNAMLMRILEWAGAASMPFMFSWGLPPDCITLTAFLLGGIVFYNANASQSGVLLAIGGEKAITGHFWLNKEALNTYMYISMLVAYIFGPICTFMGQAMSPGQNTVAAAVSVVTVLQIVVTYSTVSSKQKDHEPMECKPFAIPPLDKQSKN